MGDKKWEGREWEGKEYKRIKVMERGKETERDSQPDKE